MLTLRCCAEIEPTWPNRHNVPTTRPAKPALSILGGCSSTRRVGYIRQPATADCPDKDEATPARLRGPGSSRYEHACGGRGGAPTPGALWGGPCVPMISLAGAKRPRHRGSSGNQGQIRTLLGSRALPGIGPIREAAPRWVGGGAAGAPGAIVTDVGASSYTRRVRQSVAPPVTGRPYRSEVNEALVRSHWAMVPQAEGVPITLEDFLATAGVAPAGGLPWHGAWFVRPGRRRPITGPTRELSASCRGLPGVPRGCPGRPRPCYGLCGGTTERERREMRRRKVA